MTKQFWLYGGLATWAVLMFALVVANVRVGNPDGSVLPILLASPLLLAYLAVFVEGRRLGDVANLKSGSWSCLIGDSFVLTSAVVFAALAWRAIPYTGWAVSWWWTASSVLLGIGAGALFHWWDGGNYIRAGAGDRLLSPTKIAHDFVAYPVLFGALICIGVPLLLNWSWHTWAVLACVGVWLVLVVCDGLRGLNPLEMHPGWDAVNFHAIADFRGVPDLPVDQE